MPNCEASRWKVLPRPRSGIATGATVLLASSQLVT